jgi:hypothetical protein
MQELKKKTHILVPDGARLLGVMDEVGVLSYGEVYVQIEDHGGRRETITGEVLVAKNPCLHPGGVRVLKVQLGLLRSFCLVLVCAEMRGMKPVAFYASLARGCACVC